MRASDWQKIFAEQTKGVTSAADRILGDVYRKAGAADRYRMKFYAGPHKFDRDMQSDAFQWFDRWLKS